jgi:surface antigen
MELRRGVIAAIALLATVVATSCATRQQTGTLVGAGAGAAIGHELTGSTLGAMVGGALGAWAGGAIGAELDARDRQRLAYAMTEVPSGQEYGWTNPDTGAVWEVTPEEAYRADQGRPCREFIMRGQYGDRSDETYGTACMRSDGTWEIVG